jgi:hypothetical protein
MQEDANQPAAVPVPAPETRSRPLGRRDLWLVLIGMGGGLALAIILMFGTVTTFMVFGSPFLSTTSLSPKESLQVFKELNELRQQINEFNEQTELRDKQKETALRQALSALESVNRGSYRASPASSPLVNKPGGAVDGARVNTDPFADIDAEVERLKRTQAVLNTILDMFTPKREEQVKKR